MDRSGTPVDSWYGRSIADEEESGVAAARALIAELAAEADDHGDARHDVSKILRQPVRLSGIPVAGCAGPKSVLGVVCCTRRMLGEG